MPKPDWVTADPFSGAGGGSSNITSGINTTPSEREGVITVKTVSGLTKSVTVSQEAYPDTIIFSKTDFDNNGGSGIYRIESGPCGRTVTAVNIQKGTNTDNFLKTVTLTFLKQTSSGPQAAFSLYKTVEQLPSGQAGLQIKPDAYDSVNLDFTYDSPSPYLDGSFIIGFMFTTGSPQTVRISFKATQTAG